MVLLALFLLFHPFQLKAQSAWEQEYKTLCSYDKEWCGKLKNKDGTWVKPKKEIVKLLKELGPTIIKHAKTLGVHPKAIAGAIMAENSLNVSISDGVQDLLVKMGVADKGKILGKKFTYGLGQLNFEAAREAENHVAKLEKRTALTDSALSEALLVPDTAIYYVGAVIRKVQDDYKKQQIDISGKPEILTTLYNLGKSETRALNAKKSGLLPRKNYFGFFVSRYSSNLDFLNPPVEQKKETVKIAVSSPSKSKSVPPKKAQPKIAQAAQTTIQIEEKKELALALDQSLALYASPPTCAKDKGYGASDVKEKYSSMRSYPVTAIAEKGKTFKVIAPTIDCEANDWQLIELKSGEVGWVKSKELDAHSSKTYISTQKCNTKVNAACLANIKSTQKENILESEDKTLVYLKPFSVSQKANFNNPDWDCSSQNIQPDAIAPYQLTQKILPPPLKGKEINSLVQLEASKKDFKKKISKIEKSYKLRMNDPKNPLYPLKLEESLKILETCTYKQQNLITPCQINLEKINQFLVSLPLTGNISAQDSKFLQHNAQQLLSADKLLTRIEFDLMVAQQNYFGYGGMGGFGTNGYYVSIEGQYQLESGDLEKWSRTDIESIVQSCDNSINKLQLKIEQDEKYKSSKDVMLMHIESMRSHLDTVFGDLVLLQYKNKDRWEEFHPYLIQLSKTCLGFMDLFQLQGNEPLPEVARKYTCYHKDLEVLEKSSEGLVSKKLMTELSMSPEGLQHYTNNLSNAYPTFMLSGSLNPKSHRNFDQNTGDSFCPNKTAEMIETLIQENPCVKNVFVPNEWLISRLNESAPKVIRRPFAEDDRFAISIGEVECKD